MTAPVPSKYSPVSTVKSNTMTKSTVASFAVNTDFLENQTIKVYVRLKPQETEGGDDGKHKSKGDKKVWVIQKSGIMDTIVQKGPLRGVEGKSLFHFDHIFDEEAKTPLLYKSIARSMVHTVVGGKHATIFAYGQTGAGKTYTMQGDGQAVSGQAGIIQLVVSDLFRFSRMGENSSRDFNIKVSYVEVYNERIRDLLSDDLGDNTSQGTPQGVPQVPNGDDIQIRVSGTGEVTMNCVTKRVHTVEDVLELLIFGNSNRVVAKTDMNNHSSRSHAIFRLTVESNAKGVGIGAEVMRVADFNLVDLAGSESAKMSASSGKRQKEGAKINQSLLSLSNVINNLSLPEKKRPKHINYRDSKLTRILQPHLSGNAEIAIICCASIYKSDLEETRSTLKFGARAKLVTLKPTVNELNDDSALIKKLQQELDRAREQLEAFKKDGVPDEQRVRSPPAQINTRPGVPMSQASDQHSVDDEFDDDDISYGYEDMDAGPGHREFEFVSNQEMPPPEAGLDEGEQQAPGMGGRTYVMPKSTEVPEAMQRDFDQGNAAENSTGMKREYVMPKNHELSDIPLDLGREFGDEDEPGRNQRELDGRDTSDAMDQLLSGRFDEADTDAEESDEEHDNLHSSGVFFMDHNDHDTDDDKYRKGASSGSQSDNSALYDLERKDSKFKPHKNGSRHDQTGPTADETIEIDGPERSFDGLSQKFGSVMSRPDTLRGASTAGGRSKHGSIDSVDNFNGRGGHQVSWDTMDLDTMQKDQAGRPLKAIQSLYHRETQIPDEIIIMRVAIQEDNKDNMCLTDKLNEAEARATFMQSRLELADDLVEGIFKDLERARLCIHDLVFRNAQLSAKLKDKKREDIKKEYLEGEVVVEQYWLLKGAMYVGLFFFLSGGYEFFMAMVFLVWLILELNLGDST